MASGDITLDLQFTFGLFNLPYDPLNTSVVPATCTSPNGVGNSAVVCAHWGGNGESCLTFPKVGPPSPRGIQRRTRDRWLWQVEEVINGRTVGKSRVEQGDDVTQRQDPEQEWTELRPCLSNMPELGLQLTCPRCQLGA